MPGAGLFEPGKEREWEFLDQAKFRGTMVGMEGDKVQIRMADGVTRDFWPAAAEAISGAYLQRSAAKLPSNPTRPVLPAGSAPVIDLNAASLTDGSLRKWGNSGRAGGSFLAMNQPPQVANVNGKKAVVFEHPPWLLPMGFQTMVSDFIVPESVTGDGKLTVIAWLNNQGSVVDRETFLSWGARDCGELDTPDFSYGCYEALQWYDDKLVVPAARFPHFNQWHQFAFVISPSDKDRNRLRLDLYIDGEPVAGKLVRKPNPKLLADNLAFLGCAWEAWWGHSWETRPARPFTGALASLQVYDRALDLAEIRKLRGAASPPSTRTPDTAAGATNPDPANGSNEVQAGIERLSWKPDPDAISQVLHFGTDREAVLKGTAAKVTLKNHVEQAYLLPDLNLPHLQTGTSYHWRVEQICETKQADGPAELWSFTTSKFDLEFDGPVSEAFPTELQQDGFYSRFMDAGGYPIISPPGNEDVHLRAARHALKKLLGKRPDLVKALQSSHSATHLASQENRGWGWSHFTCSSYGEGEAILREGAILMHEMGHQFHMQGAEQMHHDFRHRLAENFRAGRHEQLWMGDYGGRNMWENVAVCASWWLNDMTQDEGDLRPRELLRLNDPRAYHLLADYWPGDRIIDLRPASGLQTDATGNLVEWRNDAGIEFFRPNDGWHFYERSVGKFTPVAGKPALRSIAGVSALAFSGNDSLIWDKSMWDGLDGNRSWSVDFWAYREADATGEETLVEWRTADSPGAKLLWGAPEDSCELAGGAKGKWKNKPAAKGWHHFAWVFTGGGVADGAGECRVYVDGKLDHTVSAKLALPPEAKLKVAQGFTGALAQLRVYNYDLHPLQLEELWQRESPLYQRPSPVSANRLLVDMEPAILAPVDDSETWPLYPASLNKPWLRSWVNLGTLGGKLHNGAGDPQVSQPRHGIVQGTRAITFDGKSHLISSFSGPLPQSATLELWACPAADAGNGIIVQWGSLTISSKLLRPGQWQHLAMTHENGKITAFVNGVSAATGKLSGSPGAADRLILGSAWDGKAISNGYRGHLAAVRVYDGLLTGAQLSQSAARGELRRANLSDPATGAEVVAARNPALGWQLALGPVASRADVYLGTQAGEVAMAQRGAASYQGQQAPGEFRPKLQPGTRYYWRVDSLDTKGAVLMTGTVWSFRTAEGLVLDLDAEGLKPGLIESWPNKGTAGGGFVPGTERENWRPVVTEVDGLKGIDFSGSKSLVSSQPAPAGLLGSGSFTVSLWAFCRSTGGLEREQTMLSWGRRPKDRAEFCWGSSEKNGAFIGGPKAEFGYRGSETPVDRMRHNAPVLDGWRHIAYTYDAKAKKLRIFVDGKLNREDPLELAIPPGELIFLGGVRSGRLPGAPFGGFLGQVAVAGSVLGDAQIMRLAVGMPAAKVHGDWLVRLETDGLELGPLAAWPNSGSLGGEFALAPEIPAEPRAEQVGGRAAVTFDGQKDFLRSTVPTPPTLVGDQPFTVEMWVMNPKPADIETVFSLAPAVAMKSFPNDAIGRAAQFQFGTAKESGRDRRPGFFASGANPRNVGWKETAALTPGWHHLAQVYGGGYRGTFKVYLDGELINEHGFFTLDTIGNHPMHLGAAWNTSRGTSNMFSGSLAKLQVFDYVRTEDEIRRETSAPGSEP